MKYLKKFESINNEPKLGDYIMLKLEDVRLYVSHPSTKTLRYVDFINNNIGIVNNIEYDTNNNLVTIRVVYENVPSELKQYFLTGMKTKNNSYSRDYSPKNIVDFASTKEELEMRLSANKYNI